MKELPQHISDALSAKKTSLGDSPALPPSDDYIKRMLSTYFDEISKEFEGRNTNDVVKELNTTVVECQNEERKCRPALEKLCSDIVSDMFQIPEDTIRIEIHLTDTIDTSDYRMMPEEDDDFSFEDIEDMQNLGSEVYKRRILNALVEGASESVAYNVGLYVQKLFEINPSLPQLYSKVIKYSQYLTYALDETKLKDSGKEGGTVKVIMKPAPDMLEVKAEATMFPILLQNAIKGILEVAILQGLPDNKDKAYYVMKKADYKLAEVWDSRFGIPLWQRLEKSVKDKSEVGLNFFFMELSMLPVSIFNETLQEVFVGTKKGETMISDICDKIIAEKEEEDFNDYILKNNDMYPIEDGFFTEDEFPSERPFGY